MIALATLATVIASQAVITGAFSITRQAIQLGLIPRLAIVHTSATQLGQIYIPRVNWASCWAFCCWSGCSAPRARWLRPMELR